MANFGLGSVDYEPLPAIRAISNLSSTFIKEKSKKQSEKLSNRPGSLSPLHLTYKTLNESDFHGLCIGFMKLQSRNSHFIHESMDKLPSALAEPKLLSKHYNFSENKRLTNKLDFSKIKKSIRNGEKYSEKYSVISKDQRFAGRNPQSLKLAKGVIPVTMSKLSKKINENSVKLRVNGFIKSFSPRTPNHLLDTSLFTFKK